MNKFVKVTQCGENGKALGERMVRINRIDTLVESSIHKPDEEPYFELHLLRGPIKYQETYWVSITEESGEELMLILEKLEEEDK